MSQGEDILQSDPDTKHVAAGLAAMECVIVQDLFLNETANYAHVFLPGSTFLEKDGTFTNAERRIQRVRKVMAPRNGYADWEITVMLAKAMGFEMSYRHPSEIMDEIAKLTPTFTGVSYAKLDELGSVQWPCNEKAPEGTPVMHLNGFVRGKGKFFITEYVATDERTGPRFPLLLTTGRILSQYNVGAQTRRTDNVVWHDEDRLEIHPHDAEQRGIRDGDWVKLASRAGETSLRALIPERVAPGVVYTTFHHPDTQANVITTDFSDWATNCPEYKVTAVQIAPSNGPTEWQEQYEELARKSFGRLICRRVRLALGGKTCAACDRSLWIAQRSAPWPSPQGCLAPFALQPGAPSLGGQRPCKRAAHRSARDPRGQARLAAPARQDHSRATPPRTRRIPQARRESP